MRDARKTFLPFRGESTSESNPGGRSWLSRNDFGRREIGHIDRDRNGEKKLVEEKAFDSNVTVNSFNQRADRLRNISKSDPYIRRINFVVVILRVCRVRERC